MKQAVKFSASLALSLSLLISQSGCTYMLWNDGDLDAYKEPAQNPNLHLFQSEERQDFLVIYREQSDRNNAVRTRAYWLNDNENRLNRQHAPIFVSKNLAQNLSPVPVFASMPIEANTNRNFYAICQKKSSFALYLGSRQVGSYNLPVYVDRRSTAEKVALTPVAVTVDVVIIGGVVVLLLLVSANSNNS